MNPFIYVKRLFASALTLVLVGVVPAGAVTNTWEPAALLNDARFDHTATLVPNGHVLVAGGVAVSSDVASSTELYDPAGNKWVTARSLIIGRNNHTATLLPSGKVLVAGGFGTAALNSAELYDSASNSWSAAPSLTVPRYFHTATLLSSGQVLVAAGSSDFANPQTNSAELYDPGTNTWVSVGSLSTARYYHTATLLPSGKVLVTGGRSDSLDQVLASAELYDPVSRTWSAAAPLPTARYQHTAMLLTSGKVLVVGGCNGTPCASAALYNPNTNSWAAAGSMATARAGHTATLLPSGKVLVAGGFGLTGDSLSSAELYDPGTNTWSPAGTLVTLQSAHTATLLPSGKVLVAGGSSNQQRYIATTDLYDPATNTWGAAGSLTTARRSHTSTVLPSGKVFVAGGANAGGAVSNNTELYDPANNSWGAAGLLTTSRFQHTATLLPSGNVVIAGGFSFTSGIVGNAELYDPVSNTTSTGGSLVTPRYLHTATLLPSGKVMLAGGTNANGLLASTEVYDPAGNVWAAAASLTVARYDHVATLLSSGKVFVAAGSDTSGNFLASAEIYDPAGDLWTTASSLTTARDTPTATLLPSGKVLVAGGVGASGYLASAELYDPESDTWSAAGSMIAPRYLHTATLLPSGLVLVAGGLNSGGKVATTEIYDPVSNTWSASATLATGRASHTATLLLSGKVLVSAGTGAANVISSAELFDPGLMPTSARAPNLLVINDYLLPSSSLMAGANGSSTDAAGATIATGFVPLLEANGGTENNSASNAPVFQVQRLDNDQMRFVPNNEGMSWTDTMFFGSATAFAGFPSGPVRVRVWVNGVPSASLYSTFATSPGSVSTPAAVGGNRQASVTFTAVAEDGGAPVTSYIATASPGAAQASCSAPCSTIVFNPIAAGNYTFRVAAANDAGLGPASPSSNSVLVTNLHTVTPSAIGNGSINPSTAQSVNDGATTSFTVTPNAGNHLVNVTGSCGGSLVGNTYTTNAITGDCTVIANFAVDVTTHTVTPSVTGNGSISPNTAQTVNDGATKSFTVTPNAGNQLVNVSGSCGGTLAGNVYTTNAITADCTVIANFVATHTVTPSYTGNGSISPNTAQTVNDGATTTFTVTPNPGNHLVDVTGTCGGSLVGNTYTTNTIAADCTVIANFAANVTTHSVTPSVTGNGAISPNTAQTVNDGATTSFAVTPNPGNHLVNVTGTCGGSLVGNTYTTNAITTDCTVIANFAANVTTHNVTPSVTGNGAISPNTAQTVNDGATTSFAVTSNPGNHLVNVTGTCGGSLVGNTYTTNAITTDCTVIANFAVDVTTHIVTPSVTGNGTISPNTAQTVNDGAATSFTISPSAGSHLVSITGTCGGSLNGSIYTTNAVTTDCTVIANFGSNVLVFLTPPADVPRGTRLGTIVVAEQDGSGHIVADNATVDFVIGNVCGAPLHLGSVAMNNGVATLNSNPRLYTLASGMMISASTPTLSNSATFNVAANSDLLFADGFETCRP